MQRSYYVCSLVGVELALEILQWIDAICIVACEQNAFRIKRTGVGPIRFLRTSEKGVATVWHGSVGVQLPGSEIN